MKALKTRLQNPMGLNQRYVVRKIELSLNPNFSPSHKVSQVINNHDQYLPIIAPVNKDAHYFILRLDEMQSDPYHLAACRIAVRAYARSIKFHLPELAKDIFDKYPLIKKKQS
jgi:hypothetical protein